MSVAEYLDALAGEIRDLLGCSLVCCMLYCPDEALRHPLFRLLPAEGSHLFLCSEPAITHAVLAHEQVQMLCDMAMRSGRTWCLNHTSIAIEMVTPRESVMSSIAVAPLERPAGLLGFLLCLDSSPEAFLAGESLLIERSLPTLARYAERLLCDICAPLATSTPHTLDMTIEGIDEKQGQMAFLSLVCHELRAPLAAIKGYAGLLQIYGISGTNVQEGGQEGIAPALQQHYLAVIMQQTRQLELLINDLLDLSRLQLGRLVLRPCAFDLAQLCHQTAQVMQHRMDQQEPGRYHIRCSIDEALPPAHADPARTQQILTNLLENAVKYSPDGGAIELGVYADGDGARAISVSVRDQGIGIPPQQQTMLFKPFHRLEHPTTRSVSGSGLGLYISRRLIEAMGGMIHLTSREQQGTSITFTLPIAVSLPHDEYTRQFPSP